MTSPPLRRPRGLWLLRFLLVPAALATLTAAAVIAVFLLDPPDTGTSSYDALEATAVISGIVATALFTIAAIWSVSRSLWGHVRWRLRVFVFGAVLASLVVATVAITTAA